MKTGGRSIGRIGAELREIATFAQASQAGDRLMVIADRLQEIGDVQRRLAEFVETSDDLTPWRLKDALRLRGYVSARLLSVLAKRPDMFMTRDMLVYQADTTIVGLRVHMAHIRKALQPFGLDGALTCRQGCYSLSKAGVEGLQRHCRTSVADNRDMDSPRHVLESFAAARAGFLRGEGGAHDVQPGRTPSLSDLDRAYMMTLFSFLPPSSIGFRTLLFLLERRGSYMAVAELAESLGCTVATLKVSVHRLRHSFDIRGFPNPIESSRMFGYRLSWKSSTSWVSSVPGGAIGSGAADLHGSTHRLVPRR